MNDFVTKLFSLVKRLIEIIPLKVSGLYKNIYVGCLIIDFGSFLFTPYTI